MKANALISALAVILVFWLIALPIKVSPMNQGWNIDLFTQQVPFSGLGSGNPSDAFEPMEIIRLFTAVTYNAYPRSSMIVGFKITSPTNEFMNVSYQYTAITNDTGIAEAPVFRIPYNNEALFGTWTVVASTDTGDNVLINDTLTFEFGWIVNFVSIDIKGQNGLIQPEFARGSNLEIEAAMKNIAMIDMPTILSIVLFDNMSYYLSSARLDVTVPANETVTSFTLSLDLPANATVSQGTIYANAYKSTFDSGGIPYCPQASVSVLIESVNIAITRVLPSALAASIGQIVTFEVSLQNSGSTNQTFDLTLELNGTSLDTSDVVDLLPATTMTANFTWNTTNFPEGAYLVSANATILPYEENVSDNTFVNGYIQLTSFIVPNAFFLPELISWLLPLLIIVLLILVGIYIYVRRRKRETEQTLYTGWTASYHQRTSIQRTEHPKNRRAHLRKKRTR